MITIAIQSHNFPHRLSWMLQSIVKQVKPPDIIVHLSILRDSHDAAIVQVYRKLGLKIHTKTYDTLDKFQFRGLTRNRVLRHCTTPWLLFADADMVYHPDFFRQLQLNLETIKPRNCDAVFKAGRYSNPVDQANEIVELYLPFYPEHPWRIVDQLEKIRRSNVGAGYFQLIHVEHCPHKGYYVQPSRCRDGSWQTGIQKARSDQQFRRRIGKTIALPKWFSQHQIHLNHNRDNVAGHHLEELR